MELLLSLVSLAALAGFAVLLARRTSLPAPLAPFTALCGVMLFLALGGMVGLLVPAGWLCFALAAAAWVLAFAPVGRKNPVSVLAAPGFVAFWVLAAALLVFFAWRQPMYSTWDEFSFWGTAAKIVKRSAGTGWVLTARGSSCWGISSSSSALTPNGGCWPGMTFCFCPSSPP